MVRQMCLAFAMGATPELVEFRSAHARHTISSSIAPHGRVGVVAAAKSPSVAITKQSDSGGDRQ